MKKNKNAFSISKFIQKKQKRKKKQFFWIFFAFIFVHFLHFKPQNSCKKKTKIQKKANTIFQIRKIHMQKKPEIQKRHMECNIVPVLF